MAASNRRELIVRLELTDVQARVLGVLVEKEKTVPDTYPLSLNALTAGCNQKNNRSPVMELSEAAVQAALDSLKARVLVIEASGARVTRYSHNTGRVLRIPEQSVALIATLMLRGPQTAGELRINSERLHRFADISSVEAFLEELATRPESQGGALAELLPRRPGERESRWRQCLTAPAPEYALASSAVSQPLQESDDGLHSRVQRLEEAVQALRAELDALRLLQRSDA
jgi:hypothetical protein